jgi:DnaK suppressor protein
MSESGLTAEQLGLLRQKLNDERRVLTERLSGRRRALATPVLRDAEDGDWAAATVDQSLLVRLVDRDAKLLEEIHRALERISNGSYGVCEQSDEPIGFDRLLARPWARQATAVKESQERARTRAVAG